MIEKEGVIVDYKKESIKRHLEAKGKIEVISRVKLNGRDDLSTFYSPGVAEPCLEIKDDPKKSYLYTRRHNLIAVITDGSAVLGLGNIGGLAGMPVMEGKSMLFKLLGDVDAIPLCINSLVVDDIVKTIVLLEGSFGGINLEDISAPRCFEIERRLKEECSIPIFHDDQHGTAVVVSAALINSLKLAKKNLSDVKIVINGIGAAGVAISKFLIDMGAKHMILVDRYGILSKDQEGLPQHHKELANLTNENLIKGTLKDALVDADVFIGVSAKGIVSKEMIQSMKKNPIVFALANPDAEISYEDAIDAGAFVVGTGSSKYPNQINNLLAFPGIFRGTLDAHAKEITHDMKCAASLAIANMIPEDELSRENVIISPLNKDVHEIVSQAVYQTALHTKVEKTY
jgi:malate dehydrogenase (oxaloacetate-decarboxylating)